MIHNIDICRMCGTVYCRVCSRRESIRGGIPFNYEMFCQGSCDTAFLKLSPAQKKGKLGGYASHAKRGLQTAVKETVMRVSRSGHKAKKEKQ